MRDMRLTPNYHIEAAHAVNIKRSQQQKEHGLHVNAMPDMRMPNTLHLRESFPPQLQETTALRTSKLCVSSQTAPAVLLTYEGWRSSLKYPLGRAMLLLLSSSYMAGCNRVANKLPREMAAVSAAVWHSQTVVQRWVREKWSCILISPAT